MKKLAWVLVAVLTIIFTPNQVVRANHMRGILIAEVQTGGTTSASEEFVELYNASDIPINLSTYRLEYFPATAQDFLAPSRSITLNGVIAPNGRYLLSSTDYITSANTTFGATLAKTGGHLRVARYLNSGVVVDDILGWGSAILPETSAAAAPDGGKSIVRKVLDNTIQDTNNNADDFEISEDPTPESVGITDAPTEPEFPEEEPELPENPPVEEPVEHPEVPEQNPAEPAESETPTAPAEQPVLPIYITELLPNPGSPKTDANDEFIEIYNPNNEAVDLEGFILETGNSFSYSFLFGSRVIGPGQYVVLMASETNLTLSNSGGKARLIHANGTVLSETTSYDVAKDDMAWALSGSSWQWTTTVTPGQANVITAATKDESVVSKLKKAATTKPKTAKKTTAKTASAKKTKAASVKASGKENEDSFAEDNKKKMPVQPVILAGVGALALGYAAYEYRADIANHLRKLGRFRKDRGHAGR